MDERRRWGRVRVPDSKLMCRIIEPEHLAPVAECQVDNINPGGLSFISLMPLEEKEVVRLQIKFPFTDFEEGGKVWARISYCCKIHDKEKYILGVAFIRKPSRKNT